MLLSIYSRSIKDIFLLNSTHETNNQSTNKNFTNKIREIEEILDLLFSVLMMIFAVIIIAVILLQTRGSSAGLFGQSDGSYRSRRGIEQILFRLTILLIILFVGVAVLNVRF